MGQFSGGIQPTDGNGWIQQTRVELRKVIDTRAGLALVLASPLVALVAALWLAFVDPDVVPADLTMTLHIVGALVVMPFLGLRATAAEWGRRSVVHTFMLNPRRGEVLVAKLLAVCLATAATWAVCLGVATGVASLADAPLGEEYLPVAFGTLLAMELLTLQGAAVGAVLMSVRPAALALVAVFAWLLLPWLDAHSGGLQVWTSLPYHIRVLINGEFEPFQRLLATLILWLGLPMALGARRWMTRDILR